MRVEELMTKDVAAVRPDRPLKEVAALLAERRISGVPVVDDERHVLGVVSEADILTRERGAGRARYDLFAWLSEWEGVELESKLGARTAGEAMSTPAVTVSAHRSVFDAAALMVDRGVNRLPVLDAEGRLVGIVTRADLVRAYARSDDELEREIREHVLVSPFGVSPRDVGVVVRGGEVTLAGQVESEDVAHALEVSVRHVLGVTGVDARLTWTEDPGEPRPIVPGVPGRVASRPWPSPTTPAEVVDVILRDGSTLRLRPPERDDADALVDFFAALSAAQPLPALPRDPARSAASSSTSSSSPSGRRREPWSARSRATAGSASWRSRATLGCGTPSRPRSRSRWPTTSRARAWAPGCWSSSPPAQDGSASRRFVAEVMAREPGDAARVRRRRVRGQSRAGRRRDRGHVPHRPHGRVPGGGPGARPRRRRRLAPALLRAEERGGDRGVAAARDDRGRPLPQHPRERVHRRRLPGQPQRRARGRRGRVPLGGGDRRACRPRRHLRSRRGRPAGGRGRARRGRPGAVRDLGRIRRGRRARARSARSGCSRSCAPTAPG